MIGSLTQTSRTGWLSHAATITPTIPSKTSQAHMLSWWNAKTAEKRDTFARLASNYTRPQFIEQDLNFVVGWVTVVWVTVGWVTVGWVTVVWVTVGCVTVCENDLPEIEE